MIAIDESEGILAYFKLGERGGTFDHFQ